MSALRGMDDRSDGLVVPPANDGDFCDDFDVCPECYGEGWKVVCWDDICVGQGWCMHGDGDAPCPVCNPDGGDPCWPSELPRYAVDAGWTPAGAPVKATGENPPTESENET